MMLMWVLIVLICCELLILGFIIFINVVIALAYTVYLAHSFSFPLIFSTFAFVLDVL